MLLSIVIPIFNEESNIKPLVDLLKKEILTDYDGEIILVDDGSIDNTYINLVHENSIDKRIKYISLSRNFGHQFALKAGLDYAQGDLAICMDGDMQHPVNLIPKMIKKWNEGYQIVNTKRIDDNSNNSFFKNFTSKFFYFLINKLSDVKIEAGSADFRLMDRKVLNVLKTINEKHLFYRGLIPWLGFNTCSIDYEPNKRLHGESKYSLSKMFNLALNGILGFSTKPLRLSVNLGLMMAIASFTYGLYAFYIHLFTNNAIEGWTSIFTVVTFIGGIQLITIGILGEYIGKIFVELKDRPIYSIKKSSFDD